jgi:hypothetical protein
MWITDIKLWIKMSACGKPGRFIYNFPQISDNNACFNPYTGLCFPLIRKISTVQYGYPGQLEA